MSSFSSSSSPVCPSSAPLLSVVCPVFRCPVLNVTLCVILCSRQVFEPVSHDFKPRLCSVPGGGGKMVHKAREAVIPFITLYCPKVYFSPCTSCINTASVGAAIVVSRAMWRQSAELGVHRSSTSSWVGSHGFDCHSSALSRVEGWKNTGYGLPGTQH